jgi:para-nitrobenzyl esterase
MTTIRAGLEVFADALSDRGKKVYYYNFDYEIPDNWGHGIPGMEGQKLGTAHASELPFLFDTVQDDLITPEMAAFKEDMRARWANFIKNGDPNVGAAVDVAWPGYASTDRQTLILNENTHAGPLPDEEDALFFRQFL